MASNHSAFILREIIALAPAGADTSLRDPESGCDHVWYVTRVPHLRELFKRWKNSQPDLSYEDWLETLDSLYHGESIDEKQFAGIMLAGFGSFRKQLPLNQLEKWLDQLVGWKEVDSSCQSSFTAQELVDKWDEWSDFLQRLSLDDNINKRRAALALLVKPIRSEHRCILKLAISLVDQLKHEEDKLITKAISWLLRTAVSNHSDVIAEYIEAEADRLPPIALRETRNKLTTGKK